MTTVYTIGHSTRPADEFVKILHSYEVERLADIRTVPRSGRNPQYSQEIFAPYLAAQGIEYVHLKALGGLRHARKDSINTAWENASFRGYADYMQTPEFTEAIEALMAMAVEKRTVIMCAEAVPWRCHRSLVGDALVVRGVEVEDIMSEKSLRLHKLTPWARVDGLRITYPKKDG